jgi:signal recognition particle GTPase
VDALQTPIRFIGVGEKKEDLRAFDADSFAEAIFSQGENI